MKEYWNNFKYLIIALAVVVILTGVVLGSRSIFTTMTAAERNNNLTTTSERVFDGADVLTDKQENKLRKLIAKREKQTGCDIILITLNESLKEYARSENPNVPYSKFVMIYGDNFYDENMFGYNRAYGNGVYLVDNWYREDDGRVYTWFGTTGKAYERYSDAMINHLLDRVYNWIEKNPYIAYKMYVNQFYYDMTGFAVCNTNFSVLSILIFTLIVSGVFVVFNLGHNKGKKTTGATTYVNGGRPKMNEKNDFFIRKTVSQHKISSDSSRGGGSHGGGGGGGHVSSGGVSHGGGGHSR